MIGFRFYATVVTMAFWPMVAAAQESPACDYGDPAVFAGLMDSFTGEWQMHHLIGYMSMNNRFVMPLNGDATPEVVTIFRMGDGLVANLSPEIPPVDLEWADEPVWTFQREADQSGVPQPFLTSTDIEMAMGCSNDRMARLIGKVAVDLDGDPMEVTLRLMVLNDNALYGIQHNHITGSDGTVDIWGSVRLTR